MARRTNRLGNMHKRTKVASLLPKNILDYHEGLSANQVKIILTELGLNNRINKFNKWMYGQTCPVISRRSRESGDLQEVGGIYEYDLFRWIKNQKKGTPLVWD